MQNDRNIIFFTTIKIQLIIFIINERFNSVTFHYLCNILLRIENKKTLFPNYYCETWPRLPQYLTGILLGWLISKKHKISLNWVISHPKSKLYN